MREIPAELRNYFSNESIGVLVILFSFLWELWENQSKLYYYVVEF